MIRRDVLPGQVSDMNIELDAADHEEPTWEVSPPDGGRRRRFDRRTRAILGAAVAAALLANAGAAWAYWQVTQPGGIEASAEGGIELNLSARSDLNRPLLPGDAGNLTVTVTNDLDVPIRVTSITRRDGKIIADDEHRESGCADPRVQLTQRSFAVDWEVPRNTVGAFTIPGSLIMGKRAGAACRGAAVTVPVRAAGIRLG